MNSSTISLAARSGWPRQALICACLGQPDRAASEIVDEFITDLGMPRSLTAVGITEDQLDLIAEYTMLDFWSRTNPREISGPEDVRGILEMAL